MNKRGNEIKDDYKSLLLMSELEDGEAISQREISSRLGVALGLVNSYLKNLVQKGYVTVKAYPRNRYAYLLTPKGFSEKSRLAFEHLGNFTRLYRVARNDFDSIFLDIVEQGYTQVAFCGVDETAEIAFLSLQGRGLGLSVVMDSDPKGDFFGQEVLSLEEGVRCVEDFPVVVTSYYRMNQLRERLLDHGLAPDLIRQLGEST